MKGKTGPQTITFLMLSLALTGILFSQAKIKEKDLSPQQQEWLKLTSTFILPVERDVFLSLPNEREREIFIEAFWKQRDPTSGTPQNEFREEMTKRFAYVNSYFRRGTVREGWITDMGRIYMILGPPKSIERFEGSPDIHPTQVWYYYGDPTRNLPTNFAIIFYQRGGGEFKLYNPLSDGPGNLIIDTRGLDLTDHQAVYEKIKDLAPTLASVSLSLIPGRIPFGFAPSPETNLILSRVFEAPKKDVSPAYATHFLSYKGFVTTEYLTNYIESSAVVEVIRDGLLGMDLVHFSVSPRTVSIDYYEPKDQYYCHFKLSVSLRRGGKVVFQYSKDYPFYFSPDRVEMIQSSGLSVQDLFPLAEGKFGLTILLQNSVGKEFSLVEKEIEAPGIEGPVRFLPPVVGYDLKEAAAGTIVPFKVLGLVILADAKATLGASDQVAFGLNLVRVPRDLWAEGEIEIVVTGSSTDGQPARISTVKLSEFLYSRTMNIVRAFPARELSPDYYEMLFTLRNGKGEIVDKASARFILSPQESVPHPMAIFRGLPAADHFLYFLGLAIQYDITGVSDRAETFYRKAHQLRPNHLDGIVQFIDFLIRSGKAGEALGLVEALRENDNFRFSYFLLKGRAQAESGEFRTAIENLLEGNKIYNSDTRLLNSLGFCYFKTGQKKAALDALNVSLRLNGEQEDVRELIIRVEKELK
ncbi:MAG: GWxTD domain-containing protein [Candidatus Aminicenantes bacterium]